jgi:hypothetical protein
MYYFDKDLMKYKCKQLSFDIYLYYLSDHILREFENSIDFYCHISRLYDDLYEYKLILNIRKILGDSESTVDDFNSLLAEYETILSFEKWQKTYI